jgi:hypothetical protein
LLHPSQVEFGLVLQAWDGQNEEDIPSYNQIRSRNQHIKTRDKAMPLVPTIHTNANLVQHLAQYMMPSNTDDIENSFSILEQMPDSLCTIALLHSFAYSIHWEYYSGLGCLFLVESLSILHHSGWFR